MFVRKLNKEFITPFLELNPGDIFKHAGELCMKVSMDAEYNTFDLNRNTLFTLSDDSPTIYLPSELIIHTDAF